MLNGFHENVQEGTGHHVLAALSEFCNWSDDFDLHERTNGHVSGEVSLGNRSQLG